jgi:hypothetical protein
MMETTTKNDGIFSPHRSEDNPEIRVVPFLFICCNIILKKYSQASFLINNNDFEN